LAEMMNRPYWFWNWCGFMWDMWCQTKQLLIAVYLQKKKNCAGVNITFNLFIIFVCLSPKRNILIFVVSCLTHLMLLYQLFFLHLSFVLHDPFTDIALGFLCVWCWIGGLIPIVCQ
jgi:hypothetical protein